MNHSLLRKGHGFELHDIGPRDALVSPQKPPNSAVAKLILAEEFGALDFNPAASERRSQRGGGGAHAL